MNTARTKQPRPAAEALHRIDWNFAARTRSDEIESLHPYPAKFIPDLPGTLLDVLPLPRGTSVLDPFVGSGTTLVECQRRGITSVGIDLNPIACLIARVKTAPLPEGFDYALDELLHRALTATRATIPVIPNLDHWFEKAIQIEVARIVGAIERAPLAFQDIFRLGLSSILVRISNQDSDTRYAAVTKNIEGRQVPTFFATACRRTVHALKKRNYALPSSRVLERDTLAVTPLEIGSRIGAVITSPPYPNAYEYWLYHKYRMFWLGYDPLDVKQREIGARAHFFKTNHHTADHFVRQMRKTFELIDALLVPDGYVCFVVGRSKIHGAIVDNAAIVENVAKDLRFRPVYKVERAIAANRKSFNLSHANIKTETVLVLAK